MNVRRCVVVLLSGLLVALTALLPGALPPTASTDASRSPGTLTPTPFAHLPLVVNEWCSPSIEIAYLPPYGSDEDLQGSVGCVVPAEHNVAVYIYVSGWWTKPTWESPLTPIGADGRWSCDITTGGADERATRIAAFLVPSGYDPPSMSGGLALPPELFTESVAHVIVDREPVMRAIDFSGHTWKVKASEGPVGPGPNYFADGPEDVWVDESGRLHLRIAHRDGRWTCSEVFTAEPLGYGTYTFALASRVDELDRNVVLGLFTWDDAAPEHHYREIDVEFSRWGEEGADNAQFVVQPWDRPGNRHRFSVALQGSYSTHWFSWHSGSVAFASYQGRRPGLGDEIEAWTYTGPDVPPAGAGNARINLWLVDGAPPADGQGVEVIVEAFEFVPVGE